LHPKKITSSSTEKVGTYVTNTGLMATYGGQFTLTISVMSKPDGLTAAKNLAETLEHYNEWHPHSALGYRSPREYLRQQASNGLSDNRCLEI
ncbi:integrase core domain-containing protein, partial [Escherichia coli]|uniref:integrase core domain-containing protein n=1 Tax=Escherichia coli TaxID=562 RepID=UPI00201A630E